MAMRKSVFNGRMIGVMMLACITVAAAPSPNPPTSKAMYRLPYTDKVPVQIFDDFQTHRPVGRIDFFAAGSKGPVGIVAAASGRVMAIQDGFSEQLSGRAAKDCNNNYVWIAHRSGEWTGYSHLATGTVRGAAGLRVGDYVKAGQLLGYEGAVGCAMLSHLHFEVAKPMAGQAIDDHGFLLDNEGGKRELQPRFCHVVGGIVRKGRTYIPAACS